jgi:hypothetical protein
MVVSSERGVMKSSREFIVEQVVVSVVFNFGLAILLSWLALRHQKYIPLSAPADAQFDPSMGGDFLVGSFLLGMILTWVLTFVTRSNLRKNKVEGLQTTGWTAKLPKNAFLRSLMVAIFASVVIGLPTTVIVGVLGFTQMQVWPYIALHAVYVGILARIVTVPVVKRALADIVA